MRCIKPRDRKHNKYKVALSQTQIRSDDNKSNKIRQDASKSSECMVIDPCEINTDSRAANPSIRKEFSAISLQKKCIGFRLFSRAQSAG